MRVLLSGSSGLVGSALREALAGHEVTPLVRTDARAGVRWDPAAGSIDAAGLEGHDWVVHLAGESISRGRWNGKKKARIRDSRVQGTKLLCDALAGLDRRPSLLISASAVGYYGHRYGEKLHEYADAGEGFLASVCREWEQATQSAQEAGIRVVLARLGVVLSAAGGALKKMLGPFRLGVAGRIGSGGQYMSWIAIEDVVGAILHCVHTPVLRGPVNLVAPNPATNRDFTKTLGRVLRRPTVLPMPGLVARIAFGELADALLLASARVVPERLQQTNYTFRYPDLEATLRHLLAP